jgi:hypothetical protein
MPLTRDPTEPETIVHLTTTTVFPSLVEEADDLARDVLPTGLLVVHDASRGGEDDVAELTGGQELDNPLLEVGETDVVAGVDDTRLVEATVELHNDLAGAVVIDLLELANVAWKRHKMSVKELLFVATV